jgi:hypothetical protein
MDLKNWNRPESITRADAAYLLDPLARYEDTVAAYEAVRIAAQMRDQPPPSSRR